MENQIRTLQSEKAAMQEKNQMLMKGLPADQGYAVLIAELKALLGRHDALQSQYLKLREEYGTLYAKSAASGVLTGKNALTNLPSVNDARKSTGEKLKCYFLLSLEAQFFFFSKQAHLRRRVAVNEGFPMVSSRHRLIPSRIIHPRMFKWLIEGEHPRICIKPVFRRQQIPHSIMQALSNDKRNNGLRRETWLFVDNINWKLETKLNINLVTATSTLHGTY